MLALQGFFYELLKPELVWVLIPLAAIGIGALAIIFEPVKEIIQKRERGEARATYERLAREKLDVIKTALAMGYDAAELAELDRRLEQLIGAEEFKALLGKKISRVPKLGFVLPEAGLEEAAEDRQERERERA